MFTNIGVYEYDRVQFSLPFLGDDEKLVESKSFTDRLDIACSPIPISWNDDKETKHSRHGHCSDQVVDENSVDSKSYIDLQDMACSPITFSSNVNEDQKAPSLSKNEGNGVNVSGNVIGDNSVERDNVR